MPGSDFDNYPTMVDGIVVNGIVTGGTTITKAWWEDQLFAWVRTLTRNATYTETTPADLIAGVMSGNLPAPLILESRSDHTAGGSADNTSVYVRGSFYVLAFDDDVDVQFPGGWANLGGGGNCEVSAFTNADYYKQINIGAIDVAGTPTIHSIESVEAATIGALVNPGGYTSGVWYYAGYVVVQNDGTTGVPGSINVVTSSDIESTGLRFMYPETPAPGDRTYYEEWSGTGVLSPVTYMDSVRLPKVSGLIDAISMVCKNTGTGGSDLLATLRRGDDASVGSLTIPAASSTKYVISTTLDILTFTGTEFFYVDLVTCPTASETVSCRMHYHLS